MINELQILASALIFSMFIPKPKILRRKPFTCPLCLTFWLMLIYKINYFSGYLDLITIPLTFALLASLIELAINKYLLR